MNATASYGLVLQLIDEERPPDYPIDCLRFIARASTELFQGQTTFSVYQRDCETFLGELDAMVANLSGEASIRCGWGKDVLFRIKAKFVGRLGGIDVELELAEGIPPERMNRMIIGFATEPMLLSRFANALRRAVEGGDRNPVRLAFAGR